MVNADMASIEHQWLKCAAEMAAAGRSAAQGLYGTAAGRTALGRGAGGDETLEIDRACEKAILDVLSKNAPVPYALVSEETGEMGPPDAQWRLVIDPLDGSLNAKRGLEPFGVSIAVASGATLADVSVAYIEDYTRPRCYAALRGSGLVSAGGPPGTEATAPTRFAGSLVEIVLLEAGRPDRHHFAYADLSSLGAVGRSKDMRVRQIGSLALSLCHVAVGVADILLAAVSARSVDIAAGLLILLEAGGGAATFCGQDLWSQPLDLEKRSAFVAWRAGLDGGEVLERCGDLVQSLAAAP